LQTFNEAQMREYQEYQAKEKAAIEERIKRKVRDSGRRGAHHGGWLGQAGKGARQEGSE
jgi:hypothetical protein